MEAKTAKKSGGAKASPLILFSPAGSYNLFISELRNAFGDAGLPITFEAAFHVRMDPSSIDGSPAVAGGCLVEISDAYLDRLRSQSEPKHGRPAVPFRRILETSPEIVMEPIAETRQRFIDTIKHMGPYGLRYAFLNDGKASERLLNQMRAQAGKEAEVQAEAQIVLAQHAGLNTVDPSLAEVIAREKADRAAAKAGE